MIRHHRRTLLSATLAGSALLALTACGDGPSTTTATSPTPAPASTGAPAHWSYDGEDGPAHWAGLSDDYAACGTGEAQSPIDLPELGRGAPLDLEVPAGAATSTIADNGHTVQLTAGPGETTVIDGVDYHLQQMHFHAASEHTVEGKRHAIEFHFVHADADGDLAVVAVFGEPGAHAAAFDQFVAGAQGGGSSAKEGMADIAEMLPADRSYWSYDGSLTTPPCTEGVRWVVLATPIELGQDQIDALTSIHHDNDRPTQPLDGRTIRSGTAQR